jgi:acyl-CoA synthetase (AMP-forming)/AMP-acid ligase II
MEFNLADLFESLADAFPERLAVVSGPNRLTYGQLDERATRLANAWAARGIKAGDHLGLYLYNGHEYLECMLAAWKLRAVTVNCNYRYVAEELRYLFDNASLVGLIYEPDLAQHVEGAWLPGMSLKVERGPAYEAMIAEGSPVRAFGPRSERDLFVIYTGGTTGMPRGVMWQHVDLFFAALQGGNPGGDPVRVADELAPRMLKNGDGLHICSAAPMIHGSSQLAGWIALMNGGVAGVVPSRNFDVEALLDLCDAEAMHTLNLVGDAMALPLVEALEANPGRWRLTDLQVLSSAGAVLSGHVRRKLEELLPMCMVLNNFGSSETGHQGTAFYDGDETIWVMDEGHTAVLDEALDRVVPGSGVIGRLARCGHIPLGYYGDEEKTAKTFVIGTDGVRYVLPGDLATVSADGSIVFLGRGSVCINTGGEKVFAEEVEEALKHHPEVFDAVVVGVPDPRWGQRVEALVTTRKGARPEPEALRDFCRGRLAGYKVPKTVHLVDDLNRQPSGKPDYRWAQAEAIARGAQ